MIKHKCLVCNEEWKGRKENPIKCAKCKSPLWEYGHNINCNICGRLSFIPHLHHIDRDHNNNEKSNKIIVCLDCHSAIHNGFGNNNCRRSRSRRYIKDDDVRRKIIQYQKLIVNKSQAHGNNNASGRSAKTTSNKLKGKPSKKGSTKLKRGSN